MSLLSFLSFSSLLPLLKAVVAERQKTATEEEPLVLKAASMESAAEPQMTATAVAQTASQAKQTVSQAEPTESAAVRMTTAMNMAGRSAWEAERILA
jgi:hypothetical protein